MNIAAHPVQADQTIYLKDYQKPSFLVESINLNIQVMMIIRLLILHW
jgi:aminopeptidase N